MLERDFPVSNIIRQKKVLGRTTRPAEAGEFVEQQIFGGFMMARENHSYSIILVDENRFFEELDIEKLNDPLWCEELTLPFVKDRHLRVTKEQHGNTTTVRGKHPASHGYHRVSAILRSFWWKRRGSNITEVHRSGSFSNVFGQIRSYYPRSPNFTTRTFVRL